MTLFQLLTALLARKGKSYWAEFQAFHQAVFDAITAISFDAAQAALDVDTVHRDRLAVEAAAAIATAAAGDTLWCGLATGTANALVVTPAVALSGVYDGLTVRFIVPVSNTGAVTLVVGTAPVTPLRDPQGAALPAGVLFSDLMITATYVAAVGHWRLSGVSNTLTSWLQTVAGSLGALGLRIGEATSGFYRVSAGAWAAVANGIEVFRTAATGTLTFLKAVRSPPVALAWASTITIDANAGNRFSVTLAGATTFANPTNLADGQEIVVIIKQDGTGNRTASWGSYWKFPNGTAPVLSTVANMTDRVIGDTVGTAAIQAVAVKGWAA